MEECNILYIPIYQRQLGRSRRRWEDNIKIDLQEVGRGGGEWMELAQDRAKWRALVTTVKNLVIVVNTTANRLRQSCKLSCAFRVCFINKLFLQFKCEHNFD
jgi:hypothetical protein